MSEIHRSSVPVGFRSALREGVARYRMVMSIDTSRVGSARTARPIQAAAGAGEGSGVDTGHSWQGWANAAWPDGR